MKHIGLQWIDVHLSKHEDWGKQNKRIKKSKIKEEVEKSRDRKAYINLEEELGSGNTT